MLEITAIRAIIITMIFRSESISARLFAIRHHHGKGVKAASEPPNSNTIGLLTIQGSPQNQSPKMALCQNILWSFSDTILAKNCLKKVPSKYLRWKRANPVFHLYLCIEKDPAWCLDLNPGNWSRFINHAFCIAAPSMGFDASNDADQPTWNCKRLKTSKQNYSNAQFEYAS